MYYFKSLDGLRAVCVLAVFAFHANIFTPGWIGVQAFFVLSGFLITGILVDARQKAPGAYAFFSVFYIRRALRIFPVYYVFLAAISILLLLAPLAPVSEIDGLFRSLPFLLTYTDNLYAFSSSYIASGLYSHTWSLSVEEQFYLVWPLVIWLSPPRHLVSICVAIVVLSFGLRAAILLIDISEHARYIAFPRFPLTHFDAFAIGALARIVPIPARLRSTKSLWLSLALFLVASLLIFFINRGGPHAASIVNLGWLPTLPGAGAFAWGYLVLNIVSAHIIVVLVNSSPTRPGILSRFFELAMLRSLGVVSYGFYIFHDPVLTILKPVTGLYGSFGFPLYITISLAITLALAYGSYHFLEKPFLKMKRFVSMPSSQEMTSHSRA